MYNEILPALLLGYAALTTAYWICLIVGGGLLLFSVLGAFEHSPDVDVQADVDFDADMGFDVDAHEALHAADGADIAHAADAAEAAHAADAAHAGHDLGTALSTWFSARFMVFFLAVFGAFGVVLTHLTEAGIWLVLGLALIGGVIVGQCAHHLFRLIRRTSADSAPRPQDYVDKLARVTIGFTDADKGEIAIQVRNAERFVPAVARGSVRDFKVGDQVVVVGYRAGVAQVVSRDEFE